MLLTPQWQDRSWVPDQMTFKVRWSGLSHSFFWLSEVLDLMGISCTINLGVFFRVHQRWKQCWLVRGTTQNSSGSCPISLAGLPALQRQLNLAPGWFWWLTGLEELVAMLEISNKPSGFLFTYLYVYIFTFLTWSGLAPKSPFLGRKLNLGFF